MLGSLGLGLAIGGSLALCTILVVAQWARIRRGDLRMRSRWGVGLSELAALSIGWVVVAGLEWRARGIDPGTFEHDWLSWGVIVLSTVLAFFSVLLPVLGRRKRQRLHGRGLSS